MTATRKCKDCRAEGIEALRPTPHPGPRCVTHHRAFKAKAKKRAHDRMVRNTYGITESEYEAILCAQGGVCAICGRAKGISKALAVDHDHMLGGGRQAVRGLLCTTCNHVVIGRYGPEALQRAIDYLKAPPGRAVLASLDATHGAPQADTADVETSMITRGADK